MTERMCTCLLKAVTANAVQSDTVTLLRWHPKTALQVRS